VNSLPPFKLIAAGATVLAIPVIGCGAFAWLQWAALTSSYPFVTDTLRIAAFLLPVVLSGWALSTGVVILWRRYGWRESVYADKQIAHTRAKVQVAPLAQHLHYEVNTEAGEAPPALPAPIEVVKPLHDWLNWVDDQPHCLLAGRTKAGKTHTATAILARRLRADEIVYIVDPHSSAWLGLPTVGFVGLRPDGKPDTAALNAALLAVAGEYIKRMQARDVHKNATGQELPHDHFGRLTVLIDEANYIADVLPTIWREFVKALASGGRKVSISLIVLAQSPLVEDIQVSGSMRANFARLALDDRTVQQLIASDEKDAERKRALHAALAGQERPAAATIDAQVWLLDRRGLDAGTAPANAHALVWSGKVSTVSVHGDGKETSITSSASEADTSRSSTLPTAAEIAAIAARLGTLPPSKVVETLDGYHPRKYAEYKAKVDYVQALLKGGAE